MGLDMFAFKVQKEVLKEQEVDFLISDEVENTENEPQELHYWRKHPNLHGWMENLYREKGGTDPQFNCVNLNITEEDLDKLENDVNQEDLPHTSGFFFGESQPEDKKDDLEVITKAREALKEGYAVYYTSWW
jgi:hypothetical protein